MSTSEISDVARQMMEQGLDFGLRHAKARIDFMPFLLVQSDKPQIVEFVPNDDTNDIVESAIEMARQAVIELPNQTPYAIVRDGYFTHPTEGRSEAIMVEFGISGGIETHYVLQRYGRSVFLKRFRLVGRRAKLPTIVMRAKTP
ncbi:MAG: hypothetical protein R3C17_08690 [Planctomycetaceae bacterium]